MVLPIRQVLVLFALLLLSPSVFSATEARASCKPFEPMTFGILPFISAEQLVVRFTPLVEYLSKKLKVNIRIETASNFEVFSKRTRVGQHYDILFTAPHFFSQASDAGYQLIARVDSPGMRAVIVVPKSSEIQSVKDLKGKHIASLSPKSLASLLAMKYLSENAINPENDLIIIPTPTHNASLLSSYYGVTDASILMQPPYEAASSKIRDSMRIIAQTQRAPHMPIGVSAKINATCTAEIAKFLLEMSSSQDGLSVLNKNRFTGFIKANNEDYKNIQSLFSKY